MKTIKIELIGRAVSCGLWPQEAEKVFAAVEADKVNAPMNGRWSDPVDDYPPAVIALNWLQMKAKALEYIDAEKPMHFARMMFE